MGTSRNATLAATHALCVQTSATKCSSASALSKRSNCAQCKQATAYKRTTLRKRKLLQCCSRCKTHKCNCSKHNNCLRNCLQHNNTTRAKKQAFTLAFFVAMFSHTQTFACMQLRENESLTRKRLRACNCEKTNPSHANVCVHATARRNTM